MENTPLLVKRRGLITLEPTGFLFALSLYMSQSIESMFLLQKSCKELLDNGTCVDEENAQEIVAGINIWRPTLRMILPVFIVVFIGYFTDRFPQTTTTVLYIPIVGQILRDFCNCVNIIFWSWSPVTAGFFQAIIPGLTGSTPVFLTVSGLYIIQITEESERTIRFIFLCGILNIGSTLGTTFSGYVTSYLNLFNGFAICMLLNVIGITIGFKLIKANTDLEKKKALNDTSILKNIKSSLISYVHVISKKEKNTKLIAIYIIIGWLGAMTVLIGEETVMYLYVRYLFNMSDISYSNFALFKNGIQCFGILISALMFQRYLKLKDSYAVLIQCTLSAMARVLLIFGTKTWQLYVATGFELFETTAITVANSWVTKHFQNGDYGKICSLLGILRTLAGFFSSGFSFIYQLTFTELPGAIYILSLSLLLTSIICFRLALTVERRDY